MVETFISRFEFLKEDYMNKLKLELEQKGKKVTNVSESGGRKNVEKQPKKCKFNFTFKFLRRGLRTKQPMCSCQN